MKTLDLKPLEIQMVYDFICPWCWITHVNLNDAIRRAGLEVAPLVKYIPFEINPTMPNAGRSRREYRSAKFGSWERSQDLDATTALAGRRAGLDFNYDRIELTPNTRLAHRLLFFIGMDGDAMRTEALFDAIFYAYFSEGRDIGDAEVLAYVAARIGISAKSVGSFLGTNALAREVEALELKAQTAGVQAVPTVQIGQTRMSGTRPPGALVSVMKESAAGRGLW
jgi:predicted DsbA family dithiol-disulfide isomerase